MKKKYSSVLAGLILLCIGGASLFFYSKQVKENFGVNSVQAYKIQRIFDKEDITFSTVNFVNQTTTDKNQYLMFSIDDDRLLVLLDSETKDISVILSREGLVFGLIDSYIIDILPEEWESIAQILNHSLKQ